MIKKLAGLFVGSLIGAMIGFIADHYITTYFLLNMDRPEHVILANAIGAFILIPLLIVACAITGYKFGKKL